MKLYVTVLLILYRLSEADAQAQAQTVPALIPSGGPDAVLDMVLQQQAHMEELRAEVAQQREQIGYMEARLSASEAAARALNDTVAELQEQRSLVRDPPMIAFSAGLVGNWRGPTTVIYKNVITNVGNCYNPYTGAFTSTVKGLYLFAVTAASSTEFATVYMYKDDQWIMTSCAYSDGDATNSNGHWVSASGVLIIQLEQGDTVYMRLNGGAELNDDAASYNSNMFSGFLLYAM